MTNPFDFEIFAEIPEKKSFIIKTNSNSDLETLRNILGHFCNVYRVGGEDSLNSALCVVVPSYDYADILSYLKTLAAIPVPKTKSDIERERRIVIVSSPYDPSKPDGGAIPKEWLLDPEVERAYKAACNKAVETAGFVVKGIAEPAPRYRY